MKKSGYTLSPTEGTSGKKEKKKTRLRVQEGLGIGKEGTENNNGLKKREICQLPKKGALQGTKGWGKIVRGGIPGEITGGGY